MDYEKIFKTFLAAVAAKGSYHTWSQADIAFLVLRCMADPDRVTSECDGTQTPVGKEA